MTQRNILRASLASAAVFLLVLATWQQADAGKRVIIQLRDFSQVEVKGAGFTIPHKAKISISAVGGGKRQDKSDTRADLFAYGWIINADSRKLVWLMNYDNTDSRDKERVFDGDIELPAGSYEVYFTAYGFQTKSGFGTMEINIDRREKLKRKDIEKDWGPFSWFYGFFTDDMYKEWDKRSKKWGIDIALTDQTQDETTFNVPKELPNIVFKSVKLGENDFVKQGFTLSKPTSIRVYALGESDNDKDLADYGWITETKSRRRVWEMNDHSAENAGGARKNKKVDETLSLPAGEYVLSYVTDDSHSYMDWNSAPPDDPFNYGVTLATTNESDKANFKLSQAEEFKNVIVELTRIGNDESRSASFSLKQETELRIYALGERSLSNREMADYGWIINAKTREKVWTMEADHTEHAGGNSKNRVADDVITLPKGTYTVYYKTDDSHAYRDWNSTPPIDQKHYGITIMGDGDSFVMANVEKDVSPARAGVIAQLVKVRDGEERKDRFTLDKETKVRVYAIGEGQNREMYDYGWIENAKTGETVWEMTYGMTFHAGGGRKNRVVNTTVTLEKGSYILHYTTDDSHSYNNWNTEPPDDPAMWGITLYKDDE